MTRTVRGLFGVGGLCLFADVELDPRVLAREASNGAPDSSSAVVAARDALTNAATPDRTAVIAAARAAARAAELKALPHVKI